MRYAIFMFQEKKLQKRQQQFYHVAAAKWTLIMELLPSSLFFQSVSVLSPGSSICNQFCSDLLDAWHIENMIKKDVIGAANRTSINETSHTLNSHLARLYTGHFLTVLTSDPVRLKSFFIMARCLSNKNGCNILPEDMAIENRFRNNCTTESQNAFLSSM